MSGNHHQTTMPRCRESKATYCIKFSGYSGYSKIIVSCPHSNRVGTTIAVLPACSHYYLQVIMTSNLSSGVGLGGERKSRTYKNQIHRGIPLPEIFAPKKKIHLLLFLESIPAMCYQRKCWIEELHQLPQLHPKRHFLMKSRIDKKIISTPCSFSRATKAKRNLSHQNQGDLVWEIGILSFPTM